MPAWSEGALFILIAVACVGGFVAFAVVAVRSSKKWMAQLLEQAGRLGWQKVDDPSVAPPVVAEMARSPRSVLLLYHRERGIWLSWHRWRESSSRPGGDGRSTSTSTYDLTSYLVALNGPFPDMSVIARTKVGGFLKARRGLGTGDQDFDRRFVIKPGDSPQAAQVVTPHLVHALKTGEVPQFSITKGFLGTSDNAALDWRQLQPRADQLSHLARLLMSRR